MTPGAIARDFAVGREETPPHADSPQPVSGSFHDTDHPPVRVPSIRRRFNSLSSMRAAIRSGQEEFTPTTAMVSCTEEPPLSATKESRYCHRASTSHWRSRPPLPLVLDSIESSFYACTIESFLAATVCHEKPLELAPIRWWWRC